MICKKSALRAISFFAVLFVFSSAAFAQVFQRPRIAPPASTGSKPVVSTSQPPPDSTQQRPALTNKIVVAAPNNNPPALIKKTVLSAPVNPTAANNYAVNQYLIFNQRLQQEMNARLGIPYRYGSTSGSSYDCSGLVWSVFQAAGIKFERSSARTYWQEFEPVFGDDRYKFGTLVFFNKLGHVGIVVDENGFYQASSSKGVTYTPFAGYWEKRIVGFRRIPLNYFQ
ncbi:MAG: C40 family peptidase [Pyrinomonadaceae bacterium]